VFDEKKKRKGEGGLYEETLLVGRETWYDALQPEVTDSKLAGAGYLKLGDGNWTGMWLGQAFRNSSRTMTS
jgi:hypothetical protein